MICGLSLIGQLGHAKQSVINAFDTDFIMSTDKVMGSIIPQAYNLDAEDNLALDSATFGYLVNAFLSDRKRQGS
jgi:hypothetical protein